MNTVGSLALSDLTRKKYRSDMAYLTEFFRKNLDRMLRERGMSQRKLASQLKVASSTINSWINGKTSPTLDNLEDICRVLKVDIAQFIKIDPTTDKGKIQELTDVVQTMKDRLTEVQNQLSEFKHQYDEDTEIEV